jgi:hypothetical protein
VSGLRITFDVTRERAPDEWATYGKIAGSRDYFDRVQLQPIGTLIQSLVKKK